MRPIRLIAALCLAFLAVSPLHAGELTERKAAMERIHQQILAHDFVALDATERTWRLQRSRTASGVWKLELFYDAMWFLGQRSPAPDCSDSADAFLGEWRKRSPKSPAPFIASAARLLDTGWCYRGDGHASSVDEAAWEPFHEHVAAAHDMLARHKAVASLDPHYYAVMADIYVAEGRSGEEFAALLKEAAGREPYYYPLYDEAFRYYEPQWFGSHEAEEALASLAVEHTRARDRTSAFARVYWHAMECSCLPPPEALNLPVLRQSMKDLAELYPDPWNVAHLAKMACAIRDPDLARQYFETLPRGDDGQSGWETWGGVDIERWTTCRTLAGLRQSALAN